MPLSDINADQIANLLNARNQLIRTYGRDRVMSEADDYILRVSDANEVIAFVQLKRVQWYQCEVLHLTVAESHARVGHARSLLCEAERTARRVGARLLQCTIREDNTASSRLFGSFGFVRVSLFHNEHSGNNVGVYQKVLVPAR